MKFGKIKSIEHLIGATGGQMTGHRIVSAFDLDENQVTEESLFEHIYTITPGILLRFFIMKVKEAYTLLIEVLSKKDMHIEWGVGINFEKLEDVKELINNLSNMELLTQGGATVDNIIGNIYDVLKPYFEMKYAVFYGRAKK